MRIGVRGGGPGHFFRNTVVLTALAFYVLYFNLFHFTEEIGSKNEIIQTLIGRCKNIVFAAFPFFVPFINVDNFFSDTHYRVHVMGIDKGGHIVLTGNVLYQFINDERRLGVQAGIGFIAEQILRIQGNGACMATRFAYRH